MIFFRYCLFVVLYLSMHRPAYCQKRSDSTVSYYFHWNSDQLDSMQRGLLLTLDSTHEIIGISGFADTTGDKQYNLLLSRRRAYLAYHLLTRRGANDRSIKVTFYGETVDSPDLAASRRIEVRYRFQKKYDSIFSDNRKPPETEDTAIERSHTIQRLTLNYIYFIPDQDVLTQESLKYMPEYARILRQYKSATFEIVGHVNYQSRFDSSHLSDLYALSGKRAKKVYEMLQKLGIPSSSMTYRGVGNSQPVYVHPINDEQRRKNMLVEVIINQQN